MEMERWKGGLAMLIDDGGSIEGGVGLSGGSESARTENALLQAKGVSHCQIRGFSPNTEQVKPRPKATDYSKQIKAPRIASDDAETPTRPGTKSDEELHYSPYNAVAKWHWHELIFIYRMPQIDLVAM